MRSGKSRATIIFFTCIAHVTCRVRLRSLGLAADLDSVLPLVTVFRCGDRRLTPTETNNTGCLILVVESGSSSAQRGLSLMNMLMVAMIIVIAIMMMTVMVVVMVVMTVMTVMLIIITIMITRMPTMATALFVVVLL